MATNKHAYIRYQQLDKCFTNSRRRFTIDDLVQACEKTLSDHTGDAVSVSKRQVYEDIKFMESTAGFSIDLVKQRDGKRVTYRYENTDFSINKRLLNNDEAAQMRDALLMLSRFKGLPQFEWVEETIARLNVGFGLEEAFGNLIDFEQNQYLRGLHHFADLHQALVHNQTLEIEYQGFKQHKAERLTLYPYFLKQFNSRWFLLGRLHDRQNITNLALDRIITLQHSGKPFQPNHEIDFHTYFDDVIGVTIPANKQVEQIVLEISNELWPYIESKPIHGSQRIVKRSNQFTTISLELIPNYEFERVLLGFADAVRVVEPTHIKQRLTSIASNIVKIYS